MGEMSDYFEDFPEENPANWNDQGQSILNIGKRMGDNGLLLKSWTRLCGLSRKDRIKPIPLNPRAEHAPFGFLVNEPA